MGNTGEIQFDKEESQKNYRHRVDVLIIEDDEDFREMLSELCQNMDFFRYVIQSKDGIEASNKLRKQTFGVILLDMNLPRKGGIELLKEISNLEGNSTKSVAIISGELDKTSFQTARSYGVESFLIKPFETESFQEKIEETYQKYVQYLKEKRKR